MPRELPMIASDAGTPTCAPGLSPLAAVHARVTLKDAETSRVVAVQWDLGLEGFGVLVGMSAGFGLLAQLVWGRRTRWMWLISGGTFLVAGLLTSELWFGWATDEELQPNIDGLSLDEAFIFGLLAGVVSVTVTRRVIRGRPDVRGQIVIHRPVGEVFDVVSDERNEPSYNPALLHVEMLTDAPVGVGTRFRAVHAARRPMEMTVEITEYEPPHRLGSVTKATWADIRGVLTFEEIDDRTTLLQWSWDVQLKGLARVLGPFVGVVGGRQERACWKGLKRFLEQQESPDRRVLVG